ncbi:Retrovirus-related Pol polyprotein from transposon 17.6,Retrovirus-related Pol polyprotein from transposon 412,Retrovirus-related Pol polyprotein from transposon 297,Retrovirus-related Pol polyprotein from transposon gypsy [Mytilus edulis]|uniref:Reverse transcriptase domain-containing protein n=1 Tax=Mytilus edulis TaxID=6550 RepID=A0A8S3UA06_MYTED|nr:Retrovirus-related Pol polyprotein from transposon 17.6,Retrovirus-related Pol polyprotein from transposon 412,Retrovirus-related Pol polyprotein from transposon 297,Retrovirus-related Pol polyprotein from transposon gypsy [Mytilus edulis]
MPFGLCNAPSCFERLMDIVLKGYQWERCMCYLDDVIIFGPTFEKALENLDLVFDRFRKANLKLKPKKCFLFQHQVLYLGHLVSDKGIACDPAKIESVSDWPVPKNVNEVRSFLGLAGYYRRFIPSFSEIASPMTNLTKKGLKFLWDQDCQNAFEVLKEKLISAPILSYPIGDGEFILDTDASGHAIGAVLSQVQDGEEKVIAYASRMLSDTQQKYCTTYRELLALSKQDLKSEKKKLRSQQRQEQATDRRKLYEQIMDNPSSELFFKLINRNKSKSKTETSGLEIDALRETRMKYFLPLKILVTNIIGCKGWEQLFNINQNIVALLLDFSVFHSMQNLSKTQKMNVESLTRDFCYKIHICRLQLLKNLENK